MVRLAAATVFTTKIRYLSHNNVKENYFSQKGDNIYLTLDFLLPH